MADYIPAMEHSIRPQDGQTTPVTEAWTKVEQGVWPQHLVEAVFTAVGQLDGSEKFGFHHVGFLHPNRESFDHATDGYEGELLENTLTDPRGDHHHRKYIRVANPGFLDTFVEHAIFENGDGRTGVHIDLIDPEGKVKLEQLKEMLEEVAPGVDAEVFTTSFGGGNAPIGRVGLRMKSNPTIDVSVMFRSHYSDPKDW